MTAQSLADRVAALEAKAGSKTIEEQFREQAELIETKLESKLKPLRNDLAAVKHGVKNVLVRLT